MADAKLVIEIDDKGDKGDARPLPPAPPPLPLPAPTPVPLPAPASTPMPAPGFAPVTPPADPRPAAPAERSDADNRAAYERRVRRGERPAGYMDDVDYARPMGNRPAAVRRVATALDTGVRAVGGVAAAEGRNENLGALTAGVNAAGTALSALGPKGMAFAAALQTGATAVGAFANTVNAFAGRGRELAGLSGPLAGAVAAADVGRLRSDKREADELGTQMAKLIELQEKSDATFREIMLPVKSFILDVLNDSLKSGLDLLVEVLAAVKELIKVAAPDTAKRIEDLLKRIRDILAGGGNGDMLQGWRDDLGKFVAPPEPARPPAGVPFPVPR